jgi:hypothetical protein
MPLYAACALQLQRSHTNVWTGAAAEHRPLSSPWPANHAHDDEAADAQTSDARLERKGPASPDAKIVTLFRLLQVYCALPLRRSTDRPAPASAPGLPRTLS